MKGFAETVTATCTYPEGKRWWSDSTVGEHGFNLVVLMSNQASRSKRRI